MPKKDTAEAVLGMLSSTGASTRPTRTPAEPTAIAEQPRPARTDDAVAEELELAVSAASASRRPTAPAPAAATVPRTLRLRASTAAALRDAWLEAKRDDVLLSHQDFASDLLDAALRRRSSSR